MFPSYASNAIMAKARAKYGRRLSQKNYNDLINCQSVGDVAQYLKTQTDYADAFSSLPPKELHRGQLEGILKKHLFHQYAALCRYGIGGHDMLFSLVTTQVDVEQLLHVIRLLKFGHPEEYLFILPSFFVSHSKLDLYALARVKTFGEILDCTLHTPYYKILEPFQPDSAGDLSFEAIESALYQYLYDYTFHCIKQQKSKGVRQELEQIFGVRAELSNLTYIIRLKRYYNASAGEIEKLLLPYQYHISMKQFDDMIRNQTADQVYQQVLRSRYGKILGDREFPYIEDAVKHIIYFYTQKLIRMSTHPQVTMAAYLALSELELQNIVNIIEGVRYRLKPQEIQELLVGISQSKE